MMAPLVLLGLGAVLAMLAGPLAPRLAARGLAAAGMAAAALVAATQGGGGSALLAGDGLARLGTVLAALAGLGALALLRPQETPPEAPALVALACLGAAVLAGATHAATVFVGLELVTLALVALAVGPRTPPALEAGYKLLLLGGVGAAMLLMGLALAYGQTGRLDLEVWATPGLELALALLLAGLAFKFALAPFHMWAPDLFSGAPAAAGVVAGTVSKIAVTVLLVRLAAIEPEGLYPAGLAVLGTVSALVGSVLALRQPGLLRMLGYSSIAHSGYVALILASGAQIAPAAALYYIAAYAPGLIAALAVASALGREAELDSLRGLAWRQPVAAGALTLGLLSLAGLPIALGFWAKFALFTALLQAGAWPLLVPALAAAALGVWFYGSFILALYRQGEATAEPRRMERAAMLVSAGLVVVLGVYPQPLWQAVVGALP